MATTYHKAQDPVRGGYVVVKVTDDPAYSVVAACESEARAIQVAELLTADE